MKEEACFGAGLCEGFSGESEILVFFVVEELPAFCNDFMNDYIPIIVGTKLAFSENIFEYKRIIIFVVFCLKPF